MVWKRIEHKTDLATATTLAMSSELPSMMQVSPWSNLQTVFQESKLELIRGRKSAVEASCVEGGSLVSGGWSRDDIVLDL